MNEEGFIERDGGEYKRIHCPLCEYIYDTRIALNDLGSMRNDDNSAYELGRHVVDKHATVERRLRRVFIKSVDEAVV